MRSNALMVPLLALALAAGFEGLSLAEEPSALELVKAASHHVLPESFTATWTITTDEITIQVPAGLPGGPKPPVTRYDQTVRHVFDHVTLPDGTWRSDAGPTIINYREEKGGPLLDRVHSFGTSTYSTIDGTVLEVQNVVVVGWDGTVSPNTLPSVNLSEQALAERHQSVSTILDADNAFMLSGTSLTYLLESMRDNGAVEKIGEDGDHALQYPVEAPATIVLTFKEVGGVVSPATLIETDAGGEERHKIAWQYDEATGKLVAARGRHRGRENQWSQSMLTIDALKPADLLLGGDPAEPVTAHMREAFNVGRDEQIRRGREKAKLPVPKEHG